MLDFSRFNKIVTLGTCLFFFVLALPNLVPGSVLEAMPGWMPTRKLNLGLDLRGGSHLLLKINIDSYLKEQMGVIRDEIRVKLRGEKIGYTSLTAKPDAVQFGVRVETLPEGPTIEELVAQVDPDLSVEEGDKGAYKVFYGDQAIVKKQHQLLDQSMEIIDRRINETGTKEPNIQRQGNDRILVQVPGVENPEQLKAILGKTAKMTFHLVNEDVSPSQAASGAAQPGSRVLPLASGPGGHVEKIAIMNTVALSGELLTGANASYNNGQPVVEFAFNALGARKFGEVTQANVGKRFAIVLDNQVITAPVIRSAILGGRGIIEGNFTVESANELAILLRAGALPAPLDIIEERSVGPSLGADSIEAGAMASLIAVLLVMGFMVMAYGLFGFYANVAMLAAVVIILGALSLFQATLTLPGIAGIVLTMGMAVDANTLIYERMREEMLNGKSVLAALDSGFRMAFGTIVDSHITTLSAAFILFFVGSGTVKGFAVTLSIGILASLFTAILITRWMVVAWFRKNNPKTLPI